MDIKTGDVLIFHGKRSFISRAIRLIQGNKVTHCAVVTTAYNHPETTIWVSEIDAGMAARKVPLHQVIEHARKQDANVIIEVRRNIKHYYDCRRQPYDYMGMSYGYTKIVNCMINHFLGRSLGFFGVQFQYREWFKSSKHVCSSLVSYIQSKMCTSQEYNPNSEPDDYTTNEWKFITNL